MEDETLEQKNKRQEGVIGQLTDENQRLREMVKKADARIRELLERQGKSVL